ncbi:MAG: IS110 family transposase [Proteobacteria bacterium]|nr:IS110 family transposase [Pseudomonadota bacterium]MBI3498721.1 IS110 family transposase [Pseudomonadota bacterium]
MHETLIPRGRVVMSFPRTGRINAAQILAEIGDQPGRFLTDQQLAAEAGVCPVTFQSGKSRGAPGDGPATSGCAPP